MSKGQLTIVSGTSGSGKSIALQVLEDIGFYCIDNLPASLILQMAEIISRNPKQPCAISIDSRNLDFIGDLKNTTEKLASMDIDVHNIFLDADDQTLLTRYSETRRKHPLSDQNTSLREAIAKEREILAHVAKHANQHINTTKTTPHELRSIIRNRSSENCQQNLTLLLQSFGFKYGAPSDADFVFDIRCLPNPFWDEKLKPMTGQDKPVIEFLDSQDECQQMYQQIRDFLEHWLPHFDSNNRSYITVAIGCTGGRHRSVYLSTRLQSHFSKNQDIQTQIRHRELRL